MQELKVHHTVSYTPHTHIVEGKIKVLKSPADVSKVETGDVIVIPHTEWALEDFLAPILYEKAIAVIGVTGGALCHLAIIMRELKKPCLLLENAIEKLKDGAKVRIEINTQKARSYNPVEKENRWAERSQRIFSWLFKGPYILEKNALVILID